MSEYSRRLRAQLEDDEGRRECVYQDSEGYWTIGIGRLVDARVPGAGLRPAEIDMLFENDVISRELELAKLFPWVMKLDDARKAAVTNMSFQLGMPRFSGFKRMLAALRDERWAEAETHALDSLWARQTPKRAKRVARQLATGEWQ